MGVGGYATTRPLYGREWPDTHFIEAGWDPMPVWTGTENLALHGD